MNRLKELRNEYGLTVRALEPLINISSSSISFYEQEVRDFNTNNLKIFSDFFCVSIDYLLCHSDDGLFVLYEQGEQTYRLDEKRFKKYKEDGFIYYKNYKRYLDINNILNIKKETNISELLNYINDNDVIRNKQNYNTSMIEIPMKKIAIVEKIIKLDEEKFNAVKNMIEFL